MNLDYGFLTDISINTLRGVPLKESQILKTESEPIRFKEAPENTLLMVLSDTLSQCETIPTFPERNTLTKASVLIKISEDSADNLIPDNYGKIGEKKGYLYLVTGVFDSEIHELGEVKSEVLISYNKELTDGLVVPLRDVYTLETNNLFGTETSSQKLVAEYLEEEILLDNIDISKFIKVRSDEFTVVVVGTKGEEFRTGWNNKAKASNAIRWTMESSDLPYYMEDILKVEILK